MLLSNVAADPHKALLYMERYVNKGSPSGFSQRYTTTREYSPIDGVTSFALPLYQFPRDTTFVFGDTTTLASKALLRESNSVLIPLHPDMQERLVSEFGIRAFDSENVFDRYTVVPTASGRTVYCISHRPNLYIKLHYDGILGRVDRKLTLIKSVAGVEIWKTICSHLSSLGPSARFAFLPETLAAVQRFGTGTREYEVGCVLRDVEPFPKLQGSVLIPCFSLFSRDSFQPGHPFLLTQLLAESQNPWHALRDQIIEPLLRCYCMLVFELGLIPELNAQNLLVSYDAGLGVTGIVVRDLQGFEKDLSIRRARNLSCDFRSAPYKCIDRLSDEKNYFVRHSFSYDFKLGEYILSELLDVLGKDFHVSAAEAQEEISHMFRTLSGGQDEDHFYPRSSWFAHDKLLLTGARPYIEMKHPKFRLC